MYIVSLLIPSVVSNAGVRMGIDESNSHIQVEKFNMWIGYSTLQSLAFMTTYNNIIAATHTASCI